MRKIKSEELREEENERRRDSDKSKSVGRASNGIGAREGTATRSSFVGRDQWSQRSARGNE